MLQFTSAGVGVGRWHDDMCRLQTLLARSLYALAEGPMQ